MAAISYPSSANVVTSSNACSVSSRGSITVCVLVTLTFIVAPCIMESIQDVTGGMCETSGECSLGQTIPI